MLRPLLNDAGLTPEACASLLGISPQIFLRWVESGVVPGFVLPELASVLGVDQKALQDGSVDRAPAIWFKFRDGDRLKDSDRELVVLVRRLGFYFKQLNEIIGFSGTKWRAHFKVVTEEAEKMKHASPILQGAGAAATLREALGLGYSKLVLNNRISGNGDIIRGILRSLGILLIEMPVPESEINGCSFYVTETESQTGTPCLFVNTYRQKWFRRNFVIAHELAHSIFDIDGEVALIDFRDEVSNASVKEARADAFARHLFASPKVLRNLTSVLGLHWECLTTDNLAQLVAHTQVDLSVVLQSAVEAGLVTVLQAEAYAKVKIWKRLRELTERALLPGEYFERHPEAAAWKEEARSTTIPSRQLILPVSYITTVLNATNQGLLGEGRAAELLMMDDSDFYERFGLMLVGMVA